VVEAALRGVRLRRSVVVWATLGILLAAIGVLEYRDRRPPPDAEGVDARSLLPVPVAQLGAVEIADRGRLHRFERAPTGAWLYHGVHTPSMPAHTHTADPALSERIERAFAAFGRARTERQFEPGGNATAYGLTAPEVVILVYRANQSQPLAQYAVGTIAPDTVSRYVAIVGRRDVVTIPSYQIDNLLGLIQAAAAKSDAGVAGAR
jgi:uncharacterized protein DUF4340